MATPTTAHAPIVNPDTWNLTSRQPQRCDKARIPGQTTFAEHTFHGDNT